jgi:DNA gyrase subunit A
MKKTYLDEYTKVKRSTGIAAIKINEGDSIANVEFINEENILVITKNGMSIHFESKNVNPIGRVAAGVKTIKLDENDEVVVGLPIHSDNDTIAIFSTKGYGKKTSIKEFTVQGRGGKGLVIYRPSTVYGEIVGAAVVSDKDTILLSGQPNSICIAATDLPLLTRTSFGNIMVKSNISSVVKI